MKCRNFPYAQYVAISARRSMLGGHIGSTKHADLGTELHCIDSCISERERGRGGGGGGGGYQQFTDMKTILFIL